MYRYSLNQSVQLFGMYLIMWILFQHVYITLIQRIGYLKAHLTLFLREKKNNWPINVSRVGDTAFLYINSVLTPLSYVNSVSNTVHDLLTNVCLTASHASLYLLKLRLIILKILVEPHFRFERRRFLEWNFCFNS